MSKGHQCNICGAFINSEEEYFNVDARRLFSSDGASYSCSIDLCLKCAKYGVAFKYKRGWYKTRRWVGALDKEDNDDMP